MKKYIFLLSLLFTLQAQAQEGWTLRRCIDYAIEHNISIRQSAYTVEQDRVSVNTAKWARLPNANASLGQDFSWGRSASPVDNSYRDINSSRTSMSLSASVPLYTGNRLSKQLELSRLNLKASMEDLKKAQQDLSVNITSAYLQVLLNKELCMVANEQVALSKEQLLRLQKRLEIGKEAPAAIAEAEARVAQDELSAVQTDNSYRLALLDLSQLLELPTPEGFEVANPDTAFAFKNLTPPDNIYTEALMQRPEIQAAQYRLGGAEKNIQIARSGYFPEISLDAGLGTNYYSISGTGSDAFGKQLKNNLNKYVGVSLRMPLFDRFSTRNQVSTEKIRQQKLMLELENSKKTLYKEIQQAWYNAVAAESKYRSSNKAVQANETSFKLMTEKFANGKATSLEYNEAKTNLIKAESDRVQAKYDYLFRSKILDYYKGIRIE